MVYCTLSGMTLTEAEAPVRLCEQLTLEESDDIFFPNIPGKKPTRAKALCGQCLMRGDCLLEAIKDDLDGFFSGTTKEERKKMAVMQQIAQTQVAALAPKVEEPTASKPKYLHVVKTPEAHSWLDEVEPDDSEIFALEVTVGKVTRSK